MEQTILAAAIKSREAYEELCTAEIQEDLTDKAKVVWAEVVNYYEQDKEATAVDSGILAARIVRTHPKHGESLVAFINEAGDVSVPNLVKEVLEVKLESLSYKMSQALIAGKHDVYDSHLDQYNAIRAGELEADGHKAEVYIDKPIATLVENNSAGNKFYVWPSQLNAYLDGGLLRGHHVVIFAPTDMGKSLFAINMAVGFIKQNLKVMYCGNEDPADAMIMRFLTRITGMTKHEIEHNPERADMLAHKRNYHNLIFVELSPGTEREIEELVVEHEPDVLVVDQIRNLNMGESNKVLQLERAAMMMRRLGKRYNLIPVSLTQAADSATGKVILDRGDIDFSNVGIPGTADLMIGIGADADMELMGDRMLSLVKNKVGGMKEPVRVSFDSKLSKVN